MTVVSMVKRPSDKRGWLWHRTSDAEPWAKVFASIKANHLSFFRDDKASQASEVFSLGGSTIQDLGSTPGKLPGRSNRVLSLQVHSPKSDELRSLLPQYGVSLHADTRSLQLTAPDNGEHTQWLKVLKQANSLLKPTEHIIDESTVLNGFRRMTSRRCPKVTHPLDPPVAVSAYLCIHPVGNELLPTLRQARTTLKEGLLNLGGAREETRKSQFALNSVRRLLRDVDLSITHRQRDPEEECSLALETEVRDWLEQALNFMSDVDASIETLQMKDAPFAYDWETFGNDTMLKLQAMEEALRLGQYSSQRESHLVTEESSELSAEEKKPELKWSPPKLSPASRPVLPYSHYKLKHSL